MNGRRCFSQFYAMHAQLLSTSMERANIDEREEVLFGNATALTDRNLAVDSIAATGDRFVAKNGPTGGRLRGQTFDRCRIAYLRNKRSCEIGSLLVQYPIRLYLPSWICIIRYWA